MNFESNDELFPINKKYIYLNHCGVSAMFSGAANAQSRFNQDHVKNGIHVFGMYPDILGELHKQMALLMQAAPEEMSFLKNTAEGMSLIAQGYPFEAGDEIISYIHEYPSNHYPWKMQEKRGVKLVLLQDYDPTGGKIEKKENSPIGWSLKELEEKITKKTRLLAISHVQFTSGFAADLQTLGDLCKSHNIDLVIDAAQSLGSLPLFPSECNVSAVVASGWKWLLGPIGTGLMYTSAEFREKLNFSASGADLMKQGDDFLNHTWDPYRDGRRFEYSTASVSLAFGMTACLKELFNHYGIANIHQRLKDLRNELLAGLDSNFFMSLPFEKKNISGINSFVLPENIDPVDFSKKATRAGVFCSSRGNYLRLAPHFYITDKQIQKAIGILNTLI